MKKKDARLIKKMAKKRLKQLHEMALDCIFCDIYKLDCLICKISDERQQKYPDEFLVYTCGQYCNAIEEIEKRLWAQIEKCDEVLERKRKT